MAFDVTFFTGFSFIVLEVNFPSGLRLSDDALSDDVFTLLVVVRCLAPALEGNAEEHLEGTEELPGEHCFIVLLLATGSAHAPPP